MSEKIKISKVPQGAVYIHIPFCEKKCAYCALTSFEALNYKIKIEDYIKAVVSELSFPYSIEFLKIHTITSIYIGGGTPSIVPPAILAYLIKTILQKINVTKNLEFTVEINPEHTSKTYLKSLYNEGINRISMGVQSTIESELKILGRNASKDTTLKAMENLATSPISNFNFDLISGIPGQLKEDLIKNIDNCLMFSPKHISLYDLQWEDNTPLLNKLKKGKVKKPTDDLTADLLETGWDYLQQKGFIHYEISNFAKQGFESKHNIAYWTDIPYLGLGAGAHSFFKNNSQRIRVENTCNVKAYIKALTKGDPPPQKKENISPKKAAFDFIMTSLRTASGVSKKSFEQKFSSNLWPKEKFLYFQENGLVNISDHEVKLTKRGFLLSNHVFSLLLP